MNQAFLESRCFPQTSQWAERSLSEDKSRTFREYRYNVVYHFDRADQARVECINSSRGYGYSDLGDRLVIHTGMGTPRPGDRFVSTQWDPTEIMRHGDIAIREAASTIEAGLILTNHVLCLGVPQNKVSKPTVRKALTDRYGDEGQHLISAIDRVFNSIGYKLLSGYRNWVTHRGAPRRLFAE